MAFVSRAERKLHTVDSTTIGPGAYLSHNQYSSNPSFAPFTSTSERNFLKQANTSMTPGPGCYSIPQSNTDSYSIDNWGHLKTSAPFASQLKRFKYEDVSSSPGPGAYVVQDKWKSKKKNPKAQNGVNWARIPSAPSIPTHQQAFGYDQGPSGELVMQKNPELVHAGTFNNSVGPGHYNVQEKKKPRGGSWSKNRSTRASSKKPTTGPDIGPGSYSDSKLNLGPMYKLKQNAVFLSKLKDNSLSESKAPGPGSYNADKVSGFTKVKKVPRSLQNFGSSSLRFKQKYGEYDVGPGQYTTSNQDFVKTQGDSKAPFSSSNTRFRYTSTITPGPGAYKEQDISDSINKKVWGRQGVFGSSERRFTHKTSSQTPGPGHYPADCHSKIGTSNSMHGKPSAVFLSKSTKGIKPKTQGPAPGEYEIPSRFGASKPPTVSMHPALSKVTRTKSEGNLGFVSRAERFNSTDKIKRKQIPGPGSYDVKNGSRAKKVIVSREDRFKKLNKSALPGPGTYMEETDEWNKKSYNILFSEII